MLLDPRSARAVAIVAVVAGCGARSDLLGGSLEGDASGEAFVEAGAHDGAVDASAHDAGITDGAIVDARADGSIDATLDAPPLGCLVTRPTLLATTTYSFYRVTLHDQLVYFHDGNGIWSVSKSGGAATNIAPANVAGYVGGHSFAVDDSGVTWWRINGGMSSTDVFHFAPQRGTTTKLATLGDYFESGTAGTTGSVYLWYGGQVNLALDYVSADGGVTTLVPRLPYTSGPAVFDGTDLFIASNNGIYRVVGGALQLVGAMPPGMNVAEIALDATDIYFYASTAQGDVVIAAVPKTGGTPRTVLALTPAYFPMLAIDATFVYVVNRFGAQIVRVNKDGSGAVPVVTTTSSQSFFSVAVDDQCIYWSALGNTANDPTGVYATPK